MPGRPATCAASREDAPQRCFLLAWCERAENDSPPLRRERHQLERRRLRGVPAADRARLDAGAVGPLLGRDGHSISNLERQITLLPNIETVERLARTFGLDPEDLDARILAGRVEQEAVSLPRRQAIKWMLNLSERDMETAMALAEDMNRSQRKRRRRS